ncbi:hypothetical protein Cfor_08843 [Coptotermes formosanus]|jgi:hypothetical protein|uniref:Uncharacterized protein n=1 Tax=Coptotermes formosanus TaxID=36987 RepID=A0A6L2Q4R9_COPFO|nr:hypothetical protein Cfor_08843 [Coptotermes formosanus]
MKSNTAPGEDDVVAELIKYGRTPPMFKLITMVWEKEIMPEGWKTGIICPIIKKGDQLACENHRRITLLSVSFKILSSVLNGGFKVYIENIFGEYQCGFRPYRSTIDQIFVIQQMLEKCYEQDVDIHMLFIDFQQTFEH